MYSLHMNFDKSQSVQDTMKILCGEEQSFESVSSQIYAQMNGKCQAHRLEPVAKCPVRMTRLTGHNGSIRELTGYVGTPITLI